MSGKDSLVRNAVNPDDLDNVLEERDLNQGESHESKQIRACSCAIGKNPLLIGQFTLSAISQMVLSLLLHAQALAVTLLLLI